MGKKVPGGITPDDFITIRDFLVQIRNQLSAKAVIMRLNRTGEVVPWPVFVGWVEDDASEQNRTAGQTNEPHPGLFRFGDTNPSKVYNDTVFATVSAKGSQAQGRTWNTNYAEKDDYSKALAPAAGGKFQRYIGIVAGNRCVGTLSVTFPTQPADLHRLDDKLTDWASGSSQPLVSFLETNFDLGGPTW